jgi:hypothetical protein
MAAAVIQVAAAKELKVQIFYNLINCQVENTGFGFQPAKNRLLGRFPKTELEYFQTRHLP